MIKKILCAMLGLLFTISANAACNLYTTTNSSAGYIDGSGVVQNASSYLATDYIAVNSSTEYTVYIKQNAAISGHGVRIAFYDTNKQFISPRLGGDAPSAGQYIYNLTSPANAKYIRMSTYDGNSVVDRTIVQGRYTVDTIPTNMSQCATCDGTIVNYTSATGTVSQAGTPTPDNPIYPTFYTQGNMVLRAVGNYKDSYDATTGKITRRVGVKVLDGTEDWVVSNSYLSGMYNLVIDGLYAVGQEDNVSSPYSSHFRHTTSWVSAGGRTKKVMSYRSGNSSVIGLGYDESANNLENFKAWLAAQKAAGTPVTVYYPLTTEVVEDWTETSYCFNPIKIATTKYNETAFGPLNTALANAISVVDTVVSNTITQAASIATLQAQKQTRPNDVADDNEKCPAGIKCLLVEDANGTPHWYAIQESYLPLGYTPLEYIESTGTQYIDTGVNPNNNTGIDVEFRFTQDLLNPRIFGERDANSGATNSFRASLNQQRIYMQVGDVDIGSAIGPTATVNTDYVLSYSASNSNTYYVNGMAYSGNAPSASWTSNIPIYLFGAKDAGTMYPNTLRYYYTKIYDNNTLVRNFVPAKNPDGKIGMYDLVGGRFYENAGTGEFVAGDPVSE